VHHVNAFEYHALQYANTYVLRATNLYRRVSRSPRPDVATIDEPTPHARYYFSRSVTRRRKPVRPRPSALTGVTVAPRYYVQGPNYSLVLCSHEKSQEHALSKFSLSREYRMGRKPDNYRGYGRTRPVLITLHKWEKSRRRGQARYRGPGGQGYYRLDSYVYHEID
jgi:hypothetical protein